MKVHRIFLPLHIGLTDAAEGEKISSKADSVSLNVSNLNNKLSFVALSEASFKSPALNNS